jgi:hypothetical protein
VKYWKAARQGLTKGDITPSVPLWQCPSRHISFCFLDVLPLAGMVNESKTHDWCGIGLHQRGNDGQDSILATRGKTMKTETEKFVQECRDKVGTQRYLVYWSTPELYVMASAVVYVHFVNYKAIPVYVAELEGYNGGETGLEIYNTWEAYEKHFPYATYEEAEAYIDSDEAQQKVRATLERAAAA